MSSPLPLVFPYMQYSDISTVWKYFCKLIVKKLFCVLVKITFSCALNMGFPGGTVVMNPLANAGDARDASLITELGKFPGEGKGIPLQYSCLENSMGRGARWSTVHGAAKRQT